MRKSADIDWPSIRRQLIDDLQRVEHRCHVGLLPTRFALHFADAVRAAIDRSGDPLWAIVHAAIGARTTSSDYQSSGPVGVAGRAYAGPRTEVSWQNGSFCVERTDPAISRLSDHRNREALGSEAGFLQIHLQASRLFEIGELKKITAALPTDPQILISPSVDLSVNVQFNIYELPGQ